MQGSVLEASSSPWVVTYLCVLCRGYHFLMVQQKVSCNSGTPPPNTTANTTNSGPTPDPASSSTCDQVPPSKTPSLKKAYKGPFPVFIPFLLLLLQLCQQLGRAHALSLPRPDGEVSGTEGERLLSHTQGEKRRDREPLPNTHTHIHTHTHTHTHTHQSLAGLLLLAEEVLELEPKQ